MTAAIGLGLCTDDEGKWSVAGVAALDDKRVVVAEVALHAIGKDRGSPGTVVGVGNMGPDVCFLHIGPAQGGGATSMLEGTYGVDGTVVERNHASRAPVLASP